MPIETNAEARAAYEADRCDVYTTDASGLAATKATFDDPDAHMVFPEIVSKEPLGRWCARVTTSGRTLRAGC